MGCEPCQPRCWGSMNCAQAGIVQVREAGAVWPGPSRGGGGAAAACRGLPAGAPLCRETGGAAGSRQLAASGGHSCVRACVCVCVRVSGGRRRGFVLRGTSGCAGWPARRTVRAGPRVAARLLHGANVGACRRQGVPCGICRGHGSALLEKKPPNLVFGSLTMQQNLRHELPFFPPPVLL